MNLISSRLKTLYGKIYPVFFASFVFLWGLSVYLSSGNVNIFLGSAVVGLSSFLFGRYLSKESFIEVYFDGNRTFEVVTTKETVRFHLSDVLYMEYFSEKNIYLKSLPCIVLHLKKSFSFGDELCFLPSGVTYFLNNCFSNSRGKIIYEALNERLAVENENKYGKSAV